MSKITRITQKVFGSQAGSNQIAKFGSLAAGAPVLMGPAGVGSIQALSNYLEGWFSSVVNGAAPTIEDMNALHYLYAYQLAYLFQEGIPEYDGSTTYFTNSFVNSTGLLYVSLQDNNLGNPVTNVSFWKQVSGAGVLPDGSVLSGEYNQDVFVNGSATLGSNVTINGDLFVFNNLTNTGGWGLTTLGDLAIVNAFNFTPSSPLTTQNSVSIGGDFIFGATFASVNGNAEMKINKGQNPSFTVGGNMVSFGWNFNGSGQPEANGLNLEVFGQVLSAILILSGGDSAGVDNGGNAGGLLMSAIRDSNITARGGNSAFSGFAAGDGGYLNSVNLGVPISLFGLNDFSGGDCTVAGATTGGNTGNFNAASTIDLARGELRFNGGKGWNGNGGTAPFVGSIEEFILNGTVSVNGGDSVLANGGDGGEVYAMFYNVTYNSNGGNGAVNGGHAGRGNDLNTFSGDCHFVSLSGKGGSGTSGVGGNGLSLVVDGGLSVNTFLDVSGGNGGTAGGSGGQLTTRAELSYGTLNLAAGTGGTGTPGMVTISNQTSVKRLGITNSAAATTLGSVVKKIEVFDQYGNSLGFIPVYDTIT